MESLIHFKASQGLTRCLTTLRMTCLTTSRDHLFHFASNQGLVKCLTSLRSVMPHHFTGSLRPTRLTPPHKSTSKMIISPPPSSHLASLPHEVINCLSLPPARCDHLTSLQEETCFRVHVQTKGVKMSCAWHLTVPLYITSRNCAL
ncbi:hypothetical protein GOBAR_AA13979 [Gossypium barbadense]|uniref:Uncharacterized protein n=1 Tax=Gossypium barbadense TaxID=3634 RepID=A0A2P5XTS6_GOSBA|nr:hypothetical protein GOBAR_AA13979 [Gossypium barbadense]